MTRAGWEMMWHIVKQLEGQTNRLHSVRRHVMLGFIRELKKLIESEIGQME